MPFQPINFSGQQRENPLTEFLTNIMKGYQMGQVPSQMSRQREGQEMANQLAQLQLQQEPQKFKAEMDRNKLLNALTNSQLQNQQVELDPTKKVARLQALVTALNSAGFGDAKSLGNALYRKTLGLEEQSPQDKYNQKLNLYKAKQDLKSTDDITTANRTKNLGIVQSVEDTLPILQQLKTFKAPGQFVGKYWNTNDQATYEGLGGQITDSLLGALGLPKTNESISLISKMVMKQPREDDKHYKTRLEDLEKDLIRRKNRATGSMGKRSSSNAGSTFNLATGAFE